MVGSFHEVLNVNWLFSNSTSSSITNDQFSLFTNLRITSQLWPITMTNLGYACSTRGVRSAQPKVNNALFQYKTLMCYKIDLMLIYT